MSSRPEKNPKSSNPKHAQGREFMESVDMMMFNMILAKPAASLAEKKAIARLDDGDKTALENRVRHVDMYQWEGTHQTENEIGNSRKIAMVNNHYWLAIPSDNTYIKEMRSDERITPATVLGAIDKKLQEKFNLQPHSDYQLASVYKWENDALGKKNRRVFDYMLLAVSKDKYRDMVESVLEELAGMEKGAQITGCLDAETYRRELKNHNSACAKMVSKLMENAEFPKPKIAALQKLFADQPYENYNLAALIGHIAKIDKDESKRLLAVSSEGRRVDGRGGLG